MSEFKAEIKKLIAASYQPVLRSMISRGQAMDVCNGIVDTVIDRYKSLHQQENAALKERVRELEEKLKKETDV